MSALELELVDEPGTKYKTDQDLKDQDDMASFKSMREVALEAIQAGDVAELNRLRDGRTLVHAAISYEDADLLRDLLRAGADGNVPDSRWCQCWCQCYDNVMTM